MVPDIMQESLPRRVLMWVLGRLEELREAGLAQSGEEEQLTARGIGQYDQLKASGFVPTAESIKLALLGGGLAEKKDVAGLTMLLLLSDETLDKYRRPAAE